MWGGFDEITVQPFGGALSTTQFYFFIFELKQSKIFLVVGIEI